MLSEDDVRLARTLVIRVLRVRAVDQHDHVGILLQRTRFTQVRDTRKRIVAAGLHATVQLRDRNNRHVDLLGQQLQLAGELRDLLLA